MGAINLEVKENKLSNLCLRDYVETDAEKLLSWITDERTFRLWSADRYGEYPITPDEINHNYNECSKNGGFYPLTLIDDDGNVIGHLILRNPTEDKSIVRLGFIIVDNKVRGMGYGKKLLKLAINWARERLNAKEINLGVFKENIGAYKCYASIGFKEIGVEKSIYTFNDESWDCVEMTLKQ